MNSPVILLGYMGCGKTKIGRRLSQKLNLNFIDLDHEIELFYSKTIVELFEDLGEVRFREIEREILIKILDNKDRFVLSLGGGTPCYGNNLELLLQNEKVKSLYLKLSIPNLVERLFKERGTRPLISHLETKEDLMEFIGKHIFERVQFYNKAEFTIACDNKSEKEITEVILLQLI